METFLEHCIKRFDPDVINESPDVILKSDGTMLEYEEDTAITFTIIDDTVFYGKQTYHGEMMKDILNALKKGKGNIDHIVKQLDQNDINVIDLSDELASYQNFKAIDDAFYKARIQTKYKPIPGIISGRFWMDDSGYISFWEDNNFVLNNLNTVNKFISTLGFNPKKVKWETIKRTNGLEDEEMVSFNEYTKNKKENHKSKSLRAKQLAKHTQAGMKKAVGDIQPMKQLNPDMPNVKYKQMTTLGDSFSFKTYNVLLSEALGLSNFQYEVPADPQQRLYDFYYMSMVLDPSRIKENAEMRIMGSPTDILTQMSDIDYDEEGIATQQPTVKRDPRGMGFLARDAERLDELASVVEQTQNTLLSFLKKDLLDATYFAIAAEFRHLTDQNHVQHVLKFAVDNNVGKQYSRYLKEYNYIERIGPNKALGSKMNDNDPLKQAALRVRLYKNPLQKKTKEVIDQATGDKITQEYIDDTEEFFKNNPDYISSYAAAKTAWKNDDVGFAEFAKVAFHAPGVIKWNSAYGGKAWARIANGWLKLNEANTRQELFIWIDHIFDLAHNTGTMLNKVQRYAKNGSWTWIKQALDYKRDSKKPFSDLLTKTSPQMKYLARMIKFAMTGEAMDSEYIKKAKQMQIGNGVSGSVSNISSGGISGTAADGLNVKVGDKLTLKNGFKVNVETIGSSGKIYGSLIILYFPFTLKKKYEDISGEKFPSEYANAQEFFKKAKLKFTKYGKFEGVLPAGYKSGASNIGTWPVPIFKNLLLALGIGENSIQLDSFDISLTQETSGAATSIEQKIETIGSAKHQQQVLSAVANPSEKKEDTFDITGAYKGSKLPSTPLAHSGPAGKAGVKSLITDGSHGYRDQYSGYLKITRYGKNYLYYNPTLKPTGILIPLFYKNKEAQGKSAVVKPKKDKAVVRDLAFKSSFALLKDGTITKCIVITKGTIHGATISRLIGAYTTSSFGIVVHPVDGPVIFDSCSFEQGAKSIMIKADASSHTLISFVKTQTDKFNAEDVLNEPGSTVIAIGDSPGKLKQFASQADLIDDNPQKQNSAGINMLFGSKVIINNKKSSYYGEIGEVSSLYNTGKPSVEVTLDTTQLEVDKSDLVKLPDVAKFKIGDKVKIDKEYFGSTYGVVNIDVYGMVVNYIKSKDPSESIEPLYQIKIPTTSTDIYHNIPSDKLQLDTDDNIPF